MGNFKQVGVCFLVGFTVLLLACKSHKGASSKNDGTPTYNAQQAFNQHYYEGSKQKILGNYDEAEKEFKEALSIIPASSETMYQLANVYFKNKKIDEALHWAEMSVKKNSKYNFWYYGQLAQIYSTAKMYEKSASTFAYMVDKEPERKSVYEEAGNQYLNANKPKEALKFFEKSIVKFGGEEALCRKLQQLYFDLGQPEEAVRTMRKLSETHPGEIKFLALLAETYLKVNQVTEAKNIYLRILELDSDNGFANLGYSDILRAEGKEAEAFTYLSKAFADKRVNIHHKLKIISAYYFLINKDEKSKERAFDLAKKLLVAHPDEASAYQVNADMQLAIGELAEGRDWLKKGLAIDGQDYRIWQKLFGLDVKLANNDFLYEDSKAALELFANIPGLYIIHSQAALRIEKYDEAIERSLQGLDISFKSEEKVQFYMTLGNAWFEKGDFEKSDLYFEKALETDQQNPTALNDYAYNLFKRNTNLQKAEEMILRALKLDPENASFADTYGCILMANGKLAEAETWIKKALASEGDNAEVLEHLGDLYAKQGKTNLAIETYKKALELSPKNKSILSKLSKLG